MKRLFGYMGMTFFLFSGSVVHSAEAIHNSFKKKEQVAIEPVVGIPVGIPLQEWCSARLCHVPDNAVKIAIGINASAKNTLENTALFCIGQSFSEDRKNIGVRKIHVTKSQHITREIDIQLDCYKKFICDLAGSSLVTSTENEMSKLGMQIKKYSKYVRISQWINSNDYIQEDNDLRQKYHRGELTRSDVEGRKNVLMSLSESSAEQFQINLGVYTDLLDFFKDNSDWDPYFSIQRPIPIKEDIHYEIIPSTIIKLTEDEYYKMDKRIVDYSFNPEYSGYLQKSGVSYKDVLKILLKGIVDQTILNTDEIYPTVPTIVATVWFAEAESFSMVVNDSASSSFTRGWRD